MLGRKGRIGRNGRSACGQCDAGGHGKRTATHRRQFAAGAVPNAAAALGCRRGAPPPVVMSTDAEGRANWRDRHRQELRARTVPPPRRAVSRRRLPRPRRDGAGTEATAAIAARFGADVLAADGSVDRTKLGPIVFADRAARLDLEALVHPAVYRAITAGLPGLRARRTLAAVVDVPLLYESGHADDFDRVIVTACAPETQLARLLKRG